MQEFPLIVASGSNYEVGLSVGQKLQQKIQKSLSKNRKFFASDFSNRLKQSEPYLKVANKYFPHYVRELEGLARGAMVPFEEVFLANNREVADNNPSLALTDHCSTIAVPQNNHYLVGHNEDWDEESLEDLYILDCTINNNQIFGLSYVDTLVGASIATNRFGLIEAVNELSHDDVRIGAPKNFIARALLDSQSLEEAEELMKSVARGSGFNHVLVQNDRLWNIESSAKEYEIQKITSQKYAHTNHYTTRLRYIEKGDPESEVRLNKINRFLPKINNTQGIKKVLSNTEEPVICKTYTIASLIFDMEAVKAHISYGPPTPDKYKEYKIS